MFSKIKPLLIEKEPRDINHQLISQLNQKKVPSWTQFKQLSKILNKKEKVHFGLTTLILILAIFFLGSNLYWQNSSPAPDFGGSYSEGLIGVPNLINPLLATSDVDRDLVRLIYSGLMKFDEQGNVVPDLAASYTIDAEQKVYTFELRDNLFWHDGTELLADDIIFTIEKIKNPEFKSPLRSSFNGVSVNRVNDKTVQFVLDQPFAPFLSILTVGILPAHLWYSIPDFGAQLAELNKKPIGSGPYKFKSLTKEASGNIKNYVLESYDAYHLGQAYIDQLTLKFYPDFEVAAAALQNKNIDGLIYLPKSYKDVIKNKDVVFKSLHSPQYTAVFFNPEKNDLLKNLDFRTALALDVDKNRILSEAINNDGQVIHSPILPESFGYDSEIEDIKFNPSAAEKILDELGWKKTEGSQFRQKDDKTLSLKLTTVDQPENVKAVSIIKELWENIGIQTELQIVAKNKMRSDVIETRDYEVLVYGEIININSGPYPFWHSSQTKNPGLNLSILSNKDIDKYLEDIRQSQNDEEKEKLFKAFQNKLLELHFAIFLYNPTYTYPVGKKLQGLDNLNFVNLPADRFSNINSWYIKTKRKLN
ncbi:peptide ABC transporter substrate-binding protein [Candidatus Nomurabacteria bacterium]|nr:peptide ABC transporter substrate-binding protein [Candidatus Nomurabacteria bacterium]